MSAHMERLYEKATAQKEKLEVRALARAGVMKVPENISEPVILIAIGAGITIFRGMLQERQELKTQSSTGEVHVYYGCKGKDSPFVSELNEWKAKGLVDRIEFAFSQESTVYIQDIIRNSKGEIYTMVKEKKATIMVCANLSVEPVSYTHLTLPTICSV
eukprot:TRINITY_DN10591_c0_g1_i5.p1 TRINITY_DN10591_c0_g1~~TRINITY_DN10591_c0_g1_i5.p1  ORF type:complete len:159 (+),score=35.09 TRINITY_DN10591_c0_g1_i5:336-812(+)